MSRAEPIAVSVSTPARPWRARLPAARRLAAEAALAALAGERRTLGEAELSILLADDKAVRRLNRRWRGKDAPTNVLAFASGERRQRGRPLLLGDVVLAGETVAREAAAQGKPLADHLRHLVVHGVLHLLGFDHARAAAAARMEARERRVLKGLGVPDPYRLREAGHG